ncbi:MAG TPA: DUF721 domain-containing protein [Acidobacteriota bacterium]|jgi:predicted nucleic acid-binding Zn ribbon protein|nr:DUF721 domain-containing protein [Acidobacteriota bacterium]
MKPISDFMAQLGRDFSNQPLVVEIILKGQWKTLMGEQISGNARLLSFGDGVLQVEVSDERWLQELSRLSEEIRGRINKFFGKDVVRAVRFVQKS